MINGGSKLWIVEGFFFKLVKSGRRSTIMRLLPCLANFIGFYFVFCVSGLKSPLLTEEYLEIIKIYFKFQRTNILTHFSCYSTGKIFSLNYDFHLFH